MDFYSRAGCDDREHTSRLVRGEANVHCDVERETVYAADRIVEKLANPAGDNLHLLTLQENVYQRI
jgi:hypothetical protein